MNRFQEETAAELARNYYRSLYGEPYETFSAPDEPQPLEDEGIVELPQITCKHHYELAMAAQTIGQMVDALKAHRAECPVCGSTQATAEDDTLFQGLKQPVCGRLWRSHGGRNGRDHSARTEERVMNKEKKS